MIKPVLIGKMIQLIGIAKIKKEQIMTTKYNKKILKQYAENLFNQNYTLYVLDNKRGFYRN